MTPPGRYHVYPYREEDAVFVGGTPRRQLRPTVVVELASGDLVFALKALIDTGTSRTVFPRGAAEALGFELASSWDANPAVHRRHRIVGGDWWAQSEIVRLQLPPFSDVEWEAEVDFLLDDPGPLPFGLLGQEGFLDHWVVSFNYYDGYFVVEHVEDFKARMPPDPFEEMQARFPDSFQA